MVQPGNYKTNIHRDTDKRMNSHTCNYNYACTLKHRKDCRPNMDLVHKMDLLEGVPALKKSVISKTVLNFHRGKKIYIDRSCGLLVGGEKTLI